MKHLKGFNIVNEYAHITPSKNKNLQTMDQATLDFINTLPISDEQKNELIEKMEWEKEASRAEGFDGAIWSIDE